MTTGVARTGELSERSLIDALAAEKSAGASPSRLVVSGDLEMTALRILGSPGSLLDDLKGIAPNVARDPELPASTWMLA